MLPAQKKTSVTTSSATEEISTLIAGKRLDKIPYADKPLPQGGKIIYLTPEELEKKLSFSYTESLLGNSKKLDYCLKDEARLHAIKNRPDLPKDSAILERLASPLDSLVICNMGEEVGHGLFASCNIPPNTILFLYAGLIEPAKTFEEGDAYTYVWASLNAEEAKDAISAKKQGGLSRFLQHLPQDKEKHKVFLKEALEEKFPAALIKAKGVNLDQFVEEMMKSSRDQDNECANIRFKDPKLKELLATGNVAVSQTVVNGVPVVVCWTQYGIKKHEQAGFSYGARYWQSAKTNPRYFSVNGQLIPLTEYRLTDERESVSAKALTAGRQNPLILYQEGIKLYKAGHIEKAKIQIEKALELFKIKNGDDSIECGNCYSVLSSCYRELNEEDEAIKACEKALLIFSTKSSDKQTAVLEKYHHLLNRYEPKALYKKGLELYQRENYVLACYQFEFIVEKMKTMQEKAFCHSTLASCYRELKNIPKAIEHCEEALKIRKSSCPADQDLIAKTQIKLEDLKKMEKTDKPLYNSSCS